MIAIMMAALVAGAPAAQAETKHGDWTFEEISDPITDARRGIAAIRSDGQGSLVVKCDSNGRDLYVHLISRPYLGALRNANRNIIFRTPPAPPMTLRGYHDGSDVIVRGADATALVRAMAIGGPEMVVRATDFDYRSHDYSFSLDGAEAAMRKAYEACGVAAPF